MVKRDAKATAPKLRFPEFRGAGGWKPTPLRNLGTFIRGLTYGAGDVQDEGLLVIRSTNIQDGDLVLDKDLVFVGKKCLPEQTLQVGDVAICMSNGSKALVGKSAEYSGNYAGSITVGAFCSIFRPSLPFAKLAFRSDRYADYVALAIGGGNINNLKNSDLEAFEFAIPISLSEQQKIADCLTSLDEVIAAQGRKVEALKAHKRGLMQQLFPREGEARPRLRFPEFRNAPEWKRTTLNRVCDMQAGKFVSASEISDEPGEGTYSCYGGNGLRGFTKSFTHSGVFPLIGRQGALCGNVQFAKGEFHATEHALVATPQAGVNVTWLYYTLGKLELNKYATGQAQPGLSVDVLKSVECSVPATETEQQRIADCLSSLDTQITAETHQLAALKTHKQGLMQQLFPAPEVV